MFNESDFTKSIFAADQNSALNIYKNNIIQARISVLETIYSPIALLLGDEFFQEAAHHFAKNNHHTESNMNVYGANFGQFLGNLHACKPFPYLRDIADFAYKLHSLSYAADETYLTMHDIAAGRNAQHILKATFMMISEYNILNIMDFICDQDHIADTKSGLYFTFIYRCPITLQVFSKSATKDQAEIFPILYSKGMASLDDTVLSRKNITDFVTFLMQKHLLKE